MLGRVQHRDVARYACYRDSAVGAVRGGPPHHETRRCSTCPVRRCSRSFSVSLARSLATVRCPSVRLACSLARSRPFLPLTRDSRSADRLLPSFSVRDFDGNAYGPASLRENPRVMDATFVLFTALLSLRACRVKRAAIERSILSGAESLIEIYRSP